MFVEISCGRAAVAYHFDDATDFNRQLLKKHVGRNEYEIVKTFIGSRAGVLI